MCCVQAALLAGVGLQRLSLNDLCTHLGLPYPQLLALFNKVGSHVSSSAISCLAFYFTRATHCGLLAAPQHLVNPAPVFELHQQECS